MNAKDGDTVKVHYTGTLEDGTVFDSSEGRDPLTITLGGGRVIPGFESAVLGMAVGESRTATVPVERAYGQRRDELLFEIERTDVPSDIELEVGLALVLTREDGERIPVTVDGLTDEKVTLDANHPLAGKELTFDINLVEIV